MMDMESTPLNIFRYYFHLDPKVIKIFIRFLIKHDIYTPYMGRFCGKKIVIDDSSINLRTNIIFAKNIILSSFTWYPPEGFYEKCGGGCAIKHFNNMLSYQWREYHREWMKEYESIKDQI